MYRVIEKFRDLTDGHLYEPGDRFPQDGREIPPERLNALESGQNNAHRALIVRAEEEPENEPEPAKKPRKRKG